MALHQTLAGMSIRSALWCLVTSKSGSATTSPNSQFSLVIAELAARTQTAESCLSCAPNTGFAWWVHFQPPAGCDNRSFGNIHDRNNGINPTTFWYAEKTSRKFNMCGATTAMTATQTMFWSAPDLELARLYRTTSHGLLRNNFDNIKLAKKCEGCYCV